MDTLKDNGVATTRKPELGLKLPTSRVSGGSGAVATTRKPELGLKLNRSVAVLSSFRRDDQKTRTGIETPQRLPLRSNHSRRDDQKTRTGIETVAWSAQSVPRHLVATTRKPELGLKRVR